MTRVSRVVQCWPDATPVSLVMAELASIPFPPATPPVGSDTPRRAVIDVGTNAVKLLVGDIRAGLIHPLIEKSEQTRLGAGFYETHVLQAENIAHTARVVRDFTQESLAAGASSVRIIATSAARDALNQSELIEALQSASGQTVEVISGEQEADWAFGGVTTDPRLASAPVLILDVGGGSTEFIVGQNSRAQFRQSFRLGTVRLLEHLHPSDPPTAMDWQQCDEQLHGIFTQQIQPALAPVLNECSAHGTLLVGAGGTTTLLARMHLQMSGFDREQIEATQLDLTHVRQERERLWAMPLAARRQIVGLPPNRADVILFGVAIYERVMTTFGFTNLRVSTRGLRYAALLETKGQSKLP